MTLATHIYTHLTDFPEDKNRQWFMCKWEAQNFNDTTLGADWNDTNVMHGGLTKFIYLKRVCLHVVTAPSAIVFTRPGVFISLTGGAAYTNTYAALEPWTSSAAVGYDTKNWEVDLPIDLSHLPLSPGGPFRCYGISGYAAGDDAYISAWGWLIWDNPDVSSGTQSLASPQPVSVEGYKWPLTRR